MRRLVALVLVASVLAAAFAGTAAGNAHGTRFLVGYDPAQSQQAHLVIQAAGGEVQRSSPELGFAVVTTQHPDAFVLAARNSPHIHYVERDDATYLDGAQWNGAQWNGAQWNGAQWNGAQWNGAQWNGAQWNDADLKHVSEAQRQAAKWTEYQYQLESTNKMKWAGDSTDPGLVWQYAPWATDANFAWTAGFTGTRSASLCVLDSGVAWDHPDIAPNHVASYNAINPAASAYDDGGHGTHIAGIAAGALANAYGVAGVANVKILSAKVLDADGAGYESDLAFGLVWCALQGADVAVMALGVTETEHPTLLRALQYAADRDVLLLASAGNTGGAVGFPASDPRVVAVGAVDGRLHRASFSSTGSAVELAAPGVHMLGPLPASMGGFAFGSGTSQAVAYAAGVAALVRDIDGDLTAAQARALLASTARDLGPAGRDASFGHGLVDVRAAALAAAA
ncbi:MAG TPA: S8 family serine peptidase [Candidatus Thermoplasmatota archaeon]|nr:S8 family serine peptidase [Candidatus Thermoplasmatota archaeon]